MDAETARAIEQLAQSVRNLDARLRDVANFKPKLQAWQHPTLLNSWTDGGLGVALVGYWKDPHGVVHLRGGALGGVAGSVVFVLPADYRPEALAVFVKYDSDEVYVETDGDVRAQVITSGGGVAFFDGITFRAFQ